MVVRAIWAQSASGAIGADGGMLWTLPEDMAFFKRATTGSPVVMGRRTWQSFPDRFRPLPDRPNIVITRDEGFEAPGAEVVHSLDRALARAAELDDEVWVIGGAEIYRQAMPLLDELWVTRVDVDAEGDAYAPEIDGSWHLDRSDPPEHGGWHTSRTGTRYRFEVLRRDSLAS
ncbi:dihydrofolate reductase [Microbacterium stercoris]|uniref:Dihydrofolate reductase n=1 Tax=Microbacterium stercoris TaxID=2820289 RepID=A0A939QI92_9MICO|nr:dihydrofolate reductase [Microbacterium stercoris]MBO3663348.1 dihydrofolate reductase [Microbacterium stercoris]